MAAKDFERLKLIGTAVEALVAPDERRREFLRLAGAVTRAYKALLPDERAAPFLRPVAVFHTLSEAVRAKLGPVDISAISARIAQLLDEKLEGVAIVTPIVEGDAAEGRVDLSDIDFEKLAELFDNQSEGGRRETARGGRGEGPRRWPSANPTRVHLVERLEKLVAEYNAGSIDAEKFFEALKDFVEEPGRGGAARGARRARRGRARDLRPPHHARAEADQGAGAGGEAGRPGAAGEAPRAGRCRRLDQRPADPRRCVERNQAAPERAARGALSAGPLGREGRPGVGLRAAAVRVIRPRNAATSRSLP